MPNMQSENKRITKEEIYESEFGLLSVRPTSTVKQAALSAMDDYMKQCCLELIEYIAKNVHSTYIRENGEVVITLFGGRDVTKEQLFENFL